MEIRLTPSDNLDTALRNNREPGTEFILAPGYYVTSGAFAFPEQNLRMLAPGCKLIGAGPDKTTIELSNPVMRHRGNPTGYVEALTGSGNVTMSGFKLSLIPDIVTVGIHVWGSLTTIEDVVVTGVFGSRAHPTKPNEGFGILVNDESLTGGNVIRRCRISFAPKAPSENYITGIYMGCIGSMVRNIVEDCTVESTGTRAHCGFAANDRTTIRNCRATRVVRAVFMDTGPVRDLCVENFEATEVSWAAEIRSSTASDEVRNILFRDSAFSFSKETEWAQAVLLVDEGRRAAIRDVSFHRCVFAGYDSPRRSKGRVSGVGTNARWNFVDCAWLGRAWEDVIAQA